MAQMAALPLEVVDTVEAASVAAEMVAAVQVVAGSEAAPRVARTAAPTEKAMAAAAAPMAAPAESWACPMAAVAGSQEADMREAEVMAEAQAAASAVAGKAVVAWEEAVMASAALVAADAAAESAAVAAAEAAAMEAEVAVPLVELSVAAPMARGQHTRRTQSTPRPHHLKCRSWRCPLRLRTSRTRQSQR